MREDLKTILFEDILNCYIELEKVKKTSEDNSIYGDYLLLNNDNLNKTIIENSLNLRANNYENKADIFNELCNYKRSQGIKPYDATLRGSDVNVVKYRYGETCRVNTEKKIALTDEDLFILFCKFPATYKERIELANFYEEECQESKNYLALLINSNYKRLNEKDRTIVAEYKKANKDKVLDN
jgi:hypothetical protein